jgi:lysozyme
MALGNDPSQTAFAPPPLDPGLVATVIPDEVDPAWATVEYADGRTETRPTAEAEALPKVPEIDPLAPPPAPVGPGNPPPPDPGFSLTPDQQAATSATPENTLAFGGAGGDPAVPQPPPAFGQLRPTAGGGPGVLPPPQTDPGAAPVASADAAAGSVPGDTRLETARSENEYATDPAQAGADANAAYGDIAEQLRATEANRLEAERKQNAAEFESTRARLAKAQEDAERARIYTEESQKALKAVEDTPIEEDFFADSPGRQVAAWVALALSGFLQGATKGANPALNQMMQSLNSAQDRFIANQRANKNSKLAQRERALGDAKAAEASVRMQIPGLLEKYSQLQARQVGLQELTPGLSTAVASMKVKGVEAQQAVAGHVVARTEQRLTQEQRARGPVTQGSVELARLGVDETVHRKEAMNPAGADMGGRIIATERLTKIRDELAELVKKHGGFPHQEQLRAPTEGVSQFMARHGVGDAPDEVRTRQLLEEVKSVVAQGGNIKLFDSALDQERLNKIIDTGTHQQTMQAIEQLLDKNNRQTIATASAFSRNPQGYIEYIRRTLNTNPGVTSGAAALPKPKAVIRAPGGNKPSAEEDTLKANAGEAPATRPLAAAGDTTGLDARIKQEEGLRTEAYQDEAGVWTIGYGHTGPEVKQGMKISREEAERLFETDRERFTASVDQAVTAEVTPEQREALISLAYNIGPDAFANSTLVKKLNEGDLSGAAAEFEKWNKITDRATGEKRVSNALTRRRRRERAAFSPTTENDSDG